MKTLTDLFVVPLYVSSFSTVVEAHKYILRLRTIRPPLVPPHVPLNRINFNGMIHYGHAMDHHPILADVLRSRAETLIQSIRVETGAKAIGEMELLLVFHGPVLPADNHLLMANAHRLAASLSTMGFAEVHPVSLRDDAIRAGFPDIWHRAVEIFRGHVRGAESRNHSALVLPVLLSMGGVESGIFSRLNGLEYEWTGEALLPDPRITRYLEARLGELDLN